MWKTKNIPWQLGSTQLALAIMTIACPCLHSSLRAEMARKVLTPNLGPSADPLACSRFEHHSTFWTRSPCHPHLSLLVQAPSFCAVESPILGAQGTFLCWSLPPFHFAWCPLSLGIQASDNSCSCYPCLQLLLKNRAAWFSGAPSQDWFFFFFISPWNSCWTVPTVGTVSAAPCLSLKLLLRDPLYSGSSWVTHSRVQPSNSFWWF